jgi:hypothetical protein
MVHRPLTVVDGDGDVLGLLPADPASLADGDVRAEVLRRGSFPTVVTSGLAFRADALARALPIPEDTFRQAADGYLVRAIAFEGPVQRVDEVLGMYRRHGANDSVLGADPAGLAAAYRKKLGYLENEYALVRRLAEQHGLTCAPDLGEEDPAHLFYRMASLRLDPAAHPRADDGRFDLVRRAARARWRAGGSLPRRLAEMGVTLSCLAPRPVAARTLAWWESPRRRPAWLRLSRRPSVGR